MILSDKILVQYFVAIIYALFFRYIYLFIIYGKEIQIFNA